MKNVSTSTSRSFQIPRNAPRRAVGENESYIGRHQLSYTGQVGDLWKIRFVTLTVDTVLDVHCKMMNIKNKSGESFTVPVPTPKDEQNMHVWKDYLGQTMAEAGDKKFTRCLVWVIGKYRRSEKGVKLVDTIEQFKWIAMGPQIARSFTDMQTYGDSGEFAYDPENEDPLYDVWLAIVKGTGTYVNYRFDPIKNANHGLLFEDIYGEHENCTAEKFEAVQHEMHTFGLSDEEIKRRFVPYKVKAKDDDEDDDGGDDSDSQDYEEEEASNTSSRQHAPARKISLNKPLSAMVTHDDAEVDDDDDADGDMEEEIEDDVDGEELPAPAKVATRPSLRR